MNKVPAAFPTESLFLNQMNEWITGCRASLQPLLINRIRKQCVKFHMTPECAGTTRESTGIRIHVPGAYRHLIDLPSLSTGSSVAQLTRFVLTEPRIWARRSHAGNAAGARHGCVTDRLAAVPVRAPCCDVLMKPRGCRKCCVWFCDDDVGTVYLWHGLNK